MLVRVASTRVGLHNFKDYCVLGDDIVIGNEMVAIEYQDLISKLGVSINLSKSVISDKFTEFAKVLKGKVNNFSPLGPGLVLRAIRHRFYLVALINESVRVGILTNGKLLELLPKFCNSRYFV